MDATHIWIKRESPAQGSVCLLLRSNSAQNVLVVEGRDDKRMIWKSCIFGDPIDRGLPGKVGNVELAAADRFYIRQRGPDKLFDTGFLSGANRSGCLLEFVRAWFPKTGG
jgi:hypothetical protein